MQCIISFTYSSNSYSISTLFSFHLSLSLSVNQSLKDDAIDGVGGTCEDDTYSESDLMTFAFVNNAVLTKVQMRDNLYRIRSKVTQQRYYFIFIVRSAFQTLFADVGDCF
jgi:hypothetical protein